MNTIETLRVAGRDLGPASEPVLRRPGEHVRAFAAAGCTLHLDRDPFEAFHNLVSADILVQAKSSFSYVAGTISTDIVLHERYATNPTGEPFYRHAPGWILRDESGAFDADALPQTLLSLPSQAPRLTGRRWLSFRSRIGSFSR